MSYYLVLSGVRASGSHKCFVFPYSAPERSMASDILSDIATMPPTMLQEIFCRSGSLWQGKSFIIITMKLSGQQNFHTDPGNMIFLGYISGRFARSVLRIT